jgi:hypothetical protein
MEYQEQDAKSEISQPIPCKPTGPATPYCGNRTLAKRALQPISESRAPSRTHPGWLHIHYIKRKGHVINNYMGP